MVLTRFTAAEYRCLSAKTTFIIKFQQKESFMPGRRKNKKNKLHSKRILKKKKMIKAKKKRK